MHLDLKVFPCDAAVSLESLFLAYWWADLAELAQKISVRLGLCNECRRFAINSKVSGSYPIIWRNHAVENHQNALERTRDARSKNMVSQNLENDNTITKSWWFGTIYQILTVAHLPKYTFWIFWMMISSDFRKIFRRFFNHQWCLLRG